MFSLFGDDASLVQFDSMIQHKPFKFDYTDATHRQLSVSGSAAIHIVSRVSINTECGGSAFDKAETSDTRVTLFH